MTWGRNRGKREKTGGVSGNAKDVFLWQSARAVSVIGALACVLFLCAAVGRGERAVSYPKEDSYAAVALFLSEHASFSDALGISAYFSMPAVSAGSFSTRGEEAYRAFLRESETPWTFKDYLRDAFQSIWGVP